MKNKIYKIALYLRLSKEDGDLLTTDKKESNSIANQKALAFAALDSMPGVSRENIYDVYIDDGFTGLSFDRPDFRRLRDDIYNENVNMVVVKDLSRLGRDYIEAGRYVTKIFPSLNVRFVSILDKFDSLTATQSDVNLLIPVKTFVNDNYSRDISMKVRSNTDVMRENGLYVGSFVVYGYKKLDQNKNRIEIDEYSADIVKRIFHWKLGGLNAQGIANKLNMLGVLPPSEYKKTFTNYKSGFQKNVKAQWSGVQITRILKNKIYIGILEQGKRKKINYKINKVVNVDERDWKTVESQHDAIITKSTFDTVQNLLLLDTRVAPNQSKLYKLSGLLYCGECGRSMVRRTSKYKGTIVNNYYICSTYNKGSGCSRHSIEDDKLNVILLNAIKSHIEQMANINKILTMIKELKIKPDDILANDQELLSKYEKLDSCKRMEISLHKDLIQGIISLDEYKLFKRNYDNMALSLEESIRAIRDEINLAFDESIQTNDWVEEFIDNRNISELNRALILSFVEKIIIHEDKRIELIFKYKDKYDASIRIMQNLNSSEKKGNTLFGIKEGGELIGKDS